LEETLDLKNCIFRRRNIGDSNKNIENLLDDLEDKLDDLVEPVLSSGFNLYHVLIGAA
jgi:hypothetical protein